MWSHFRHLHLKRFPMMSGTHKFNDFWPFKPLFKKFKSPLGLQLPKWKSTWECVGSCLHTLLCSRVCMWLWVTLLACTFPCPCFGHEPKASLGLATKARACKGASQEWSPGVTFHAPRNVGVCEGMNSHTPTWALTLGVKILMDFQIFKRQLQGSKPIGSNSSLYHWKALDT
jgi:hypothetical protein